MIRNQKKKVPDWPEVLEAFQKIQGDPAILEPVNDRLMALLVRILSTEERILISSVWKCLKKYGVTGVVQNRMYYSHYSNSVRSVPIASKGEKDWDEAVELAHALDQLSEKMGTDPAVKDFLYKFKVLLWHRDVKRHHGIAIFTFGKPLYRAWAVWCMICDPQLLRPEYLPNEWGQFKYSLSFLPELTARLNTLSPPAETACHPSITAGELNYFVMYVLSLGSLLPMSDFWAILRYDRIDFLECLLVEFPDKKLPYTIEDLILIALFTVPDRNEEKTLKILQLAEKVSPGTIASFSDRYGGNLLWYSLFALEKGKLLVNSQGTVVLSPVQRFLYGLCDHEKPNCDGISFDDLTGSFPNSIL